MSIVEEGQSQDHVQQNSQVDWEKRYKDLQSFHDKTRTGLESEVNRLRKETTVFTPPKTQEELEEFKKTNPDWMGVIETVAHTVAANSIKTLQEEVNLTKSQRAAAELRAAHPDFLDIYNSDDFKQWATEQGPEIQGWLNSEYDSSKVIRAFNYYKAMRSQRSSTPTTSYQDARADQAVATRGSVVIPQTETLPRRFTRDQIERMSAKEYEQNIDAINAAYKAGLIR